MLSDGNQVKYPPRLYIDVNGRTGAGISDGISGNFKAPRIETLYQEQNPALTLPETEFRKRLHWAYHSGSLFFIATLMYPNSIRSIDLVGMATLIPVRSLSAPYGIIQDFIDSKQFDLEGHRLALMQKIIETARGLIPKLEYLWLVRNVSDLQESMLYYELGFSLIANGTQEIRRLQL